MIDIEFGKFLGNRYIQNNSRDKKLRQVAIFYQDLKNKIKEKEEVFINDILAASFSII